MFADELSTFMLYMAAVSQLFLGEFMLTVSRQSLWSLVL